MLALLQRAVIAAAEHRLQRLIHRLHRGEEVGHLPDALGALVAVEHGEALGPHEVRGVDAADVPVELREDHVEVNGSALRGEHDRDHVGHTAVLEHQVAEVIQRGRRGALAEPQHQEVGANGMHVPALQRVVVALLFGAVVEDRRVLELRVVTEQRLDQQLLGPAHAIAHRPDDGMLADHDPDVAREEEIGERRQGIPDLVERARDRSRLFHRALDHQGDEVFGRQLAELLRQHVRRHHLEGAGDEEFPHFGPRRELGEEVADLEDFREALQHGDEAAVLALRQVEVDDVVVEIVFAVAGRDRHELGPGGVHQDGLEGADLGCDVDARHGAQSNRA